MQNSPPGVVLVLLHRGRSSTRVLLFETAGESAPLPWDPPAPAQSQWSLAERLCDESWANAVTRLYASPFSVEYGDHRLGCFVGFLDQDASDAPPPPFADWQDLRLASDAAPPPWAALLGQVRGAFIARSPDEALRVR